MLSIEALAIVWVMTGFITWLYIAYRMDCIHVADFFIACFCGLFGPLPLLSAVLLRIANVIYHVANLIVWQRKN